MKEVLVNRSLSFESGEKICRFKISLSRERLLLLALLASIGGFLFCMSEVVLSIFGKSVCTSSACYVVDEFSVLPRSTLAAFAAIYFGIIFFLVRAFLKGDRLVVPFLTVTASVALAGEMVLLSRQAWDYHLHCPFCVTVGIFILLTAVPVLLRFLRISVILAVIAVSWAFALTPLSITPLSEASVQRIYRGNPAEKYILIYSDNCPHCHHIIEFCEKLENIDLYLCPKEKALAFMRSLDIKGVPVMIVDRNGEKEIMIGENLILSYLKKTEEKEENPILMVPQTPSNLEKFLVPGGICTEDKKCD
ncbi:hypothetical protein [Thermodesulfatator autotrophicus]|uniref:Vitamin K epoxide reductase domain-containing protein n=1 Tax=Thermodesulfatator autotrophicus TaxID=1795632 RepID=A0A177E5K0_9BACT|nr:hypothetical protein [Thermodesulfatator autotrophicus]OAG26771.1 hypothetical protein TH606_10585 [Thermodesulfatator autotrophicus]